MTNRYTVPLSEICTPRLQPSCAFRGTVQDGIPLDSHKSLRVLCTHSIGRKSVDPRHISHCCLLMVKEVSLLSPLTDIPRICNRNVSDNAEFKTGSRWRLGTSNEVDSLVLSSERRTAIFDRVLFADSSVNTKRRRLTRKQSAMR